MAAGGERRPRGAVVGLGTMGSHHTRILAGLPDCELAAVVDPDAGRLAQAASRHRGIPGYPSLERALAAQGLEFACIAVPIEHLAPVARQALEAGLAVLVEKPLAASEEQAAELVALARERGLLLSVGHVERFNPAVRALKARLEDDALGEIHQLHTRRLSPFPNRDANASVILDLATHDLDVMRFVTGREVTRVYAEVATGLRNAQADLLAASLRFEGGAVGLVEANWLTPTKVRQLTVTGERGMFSVDYLTQDLYFFEHPRTPIEWAHLAEMRGGGEGDMVRYALARREPLLAQWEAFLEALRRGGDPPVSGSDAIAVLAIARAIRRAADSHRAETPQPRVGSHDGV